MSNILQQNSAKRRGVSLQPKMVPSHIEYMGGSGPNRITFTDGTVSDACCLRCNDAPCAYYAQDEERCTSMRDMPADRNEQVCPTGALEFQADDKVPQIKSDLCILCGICAVRCPVGAIQLPHETGATVSKELEAPFVETPEYSGSHMLGVRNLFLPCKKQGVILQESERVLKRVEERLEAVEKKLSDNFPNHLARNLFRAVGVSADMRRVGNVHLRADIVLGSKGIERGLAEVEFDEGCALDIPRDLLDDVAVFVSRHGWQKSETQCFVVINQLPNRRSEFWHILQDVRSVLALDVIVLTFAGLMMLVWDRKCLPTKISRLTFPKSQASCYKSEVLEEMLGRALRIGKRRSALVDIVK